MTENGAVFQCGITYCASLADSRLGGLQGGRLTDLLRDGRRLGLFIGPLLEHHFHNLSVASQSGAEQSQLINQNTGDRLRSKMLTRRGCDFAMSLQIGTQREFRDQAYLKHWTNDIEGWVIVDNRYTPHIRISGVRKALFPPPCHHMSVDYWEGLMISQAKTLVTLQ